MELIEENDEENSRQIKANFSPYNLELKIIKLFNNGIKFFITKNKKLLAPNFFMSIDEQSIMKICKMTDYTVSLLLTKSVLQVDKEK